MPGRHAAPKRSRHSRLAGAALVAALAIAGVIVGFVVSGLGGSSPLRTQVLGIRTARPTSPPPVASPTVTPSVAPPAVHHKPSKARAKPATLDIRIIGHASYVEVRRPGGRLLFQGTLHHGAHRWFDQPTLTVVIGDAGASRLVIRGKVHSPAGGRGQVLRFTVRRHSVRGY